MAWLKACVPSHKCGLLAAPPPLPPLSACSLPFQVCLYCLMWRYHLALAAGDGDAATELGRRALAQVSPLGHGAEVGHVRHEALHPEPSPRRS
jgi:hypothetical protein